MSWDTTIPPGSEAFSNGDNRIRELKTDIQTALRANQPDGTEAVFPVDPSNPTYRYRGGKGATGSRPTTGQGGLYWNTTTGTFQRDNGSSWEDVCSASIAYAIGSNVASFSSGSATPVDVTGLTTTLVAGGGRPVMIQIIPGSTSSQSYMAVQNSGTAPLPAQAAFIDLYRGATQLARQIIGATISTPSDINLHYIEWPCSSFVWYDTPSAGTNVYKIQTSVQNNPQGTSYFYNVRLLAREI